MYCIFQNNVQLFVTNNLFYIFFIFYSSQIFYFSINKEKVDTLLLTKIQLKNLFQIKKHILNVYFVLKSKSFCLLLYFVPKKYVLKQVFLSEICECFYSVL